MASELDKAQKKIRQLKIKLLRSFRSHDEIKEELEAAKKFSNLQTVEEFKLECKLEIDKIRKEKDNALYFEYKE